jgi:hypothetical protein
MTGCSAHLIGISASLFPRERFVSPVQSLAGLLTSQRTLVDLPPLLCCEQNIFEGVVSDRCIMSENGRPLFGVQLVNWYPSHLIGNVERMAFTFRHVAHLRRDVTAEVEYAKYNQGTACYELEREAGVVC